MLLWSSVLLLLSSTVVLLPDWTERTFVMLLSSLSLSPLHGLEWELMKQHPLLVSQTAAGGARKQNTTPGFSFTEVY